MPLDYRFGSNETFDQTLKAKVASRPISPDSYEPGSDQKVSKSLLLSGSNSNYSLRTKNKLSLNNLYGGAQRKNHNETVIQKSSSTGQFLEKISQQK